MNQELIRIDLGGVNCYLCKRNNSYVLFDTGGSLIMDKGQNNRRQELIHQLEQAGCYPGNLKAIILTHGDVDHTMNAAYLRDHYQTIIVMHKEDTNLTQNLTVNKMLSSFQFKSLILKLFFLVMQKTIKKVSENTLKNYESFYPNELIEDGESLLQYGYEGEVIHLPGHTPGSIGILSQDGILIAGDIFSNTKKPITAINADNFKQLKESIQKLKSKHITTIYPGHGEPFQANRLGFRN